MHLLDRGWKEAAKIAAAALIVFAVSCRGDAEPETVKSVIAVQNTPVKTECTESGDGLFFFNLHENEFTSVEAASDVHGEIGGTICRLVHGGERNVSFDMNQQRFSFDPNRIFTDAGAESTLVRLSGDSVRVTPEVVQAVRAFAKAMVDTLRLHERAVIVALHNNTEGAYSTGSYLPGEVYERDAADVHVEPEADLDDFFFVTERGLFDHLRAEGFNVVLQNNASVTDDGSLSVYAAQNGIRYVNVEAQHGHRGEQARMIRVLHRVLQSADDR